MGGRMRYRLPILRVGTGADRAGAGRLGGTLVSDGYVAYSIRDLQLTGEQRRRTDATGLESAVCAQPAALGYYL